MVLAVSATAVDLVLKELRRASQLPKLETISDVAGYLDKTANGGCRTVGDIKRAIRTERDALRTILGQGEERKQKTTGPSRQTHEIFNHKMEGVISESGPPAARFPVSMGWTFVHKPHSVTTKEFLKREFTWGREDSFYCRVLDCAVVRLCEAYLAVEQGDTSGPKKVFAVVCLLRYRPNDYYNFGYKDMSEDMHPYYYNCPERILKLLTPTDNQLAKKWREECWKRLREREERPRLQKGKVVQFEEPITFSGGRMESTFRVDDPRRLLVSDRHGWRYKLSRWVIEKIPYRIMEDFPA